MSDNRPMRSKQTARKSTAAAPPFHIFMAAPTVPGGSRFGQRPERVSPRPPRARREPPTAPRHRQFARKSTASLSSSPATLSTHRHVCCQPRRPPTSQQSQQPTPGPSQSSSPPPPPSPTPLRQSKRFKGPPSSSSIKK